MHKVIEDLENSCRTKTMTSLYSCLKAKTRSRFRNRASVHSQPYRVARTILRMQTAFGRHSAADALLAQHDGASKGSTRADRTAHTAWLLRAHFVGRRLAVRAKSRKSLMALERSTKCFKEAPPILSALSKKPAETFTVSSYIVSLS